jgi:hypothetical protein
MHRLQWLPWAPRSSMHAHCEGRTIRIIVQVPFGDHVPCLGLIHLFSGMTPNRNPHCESGPPEPFQLSPDPPPGPHYPPGQYRPHVWRPCRRRPKAESIGSPRSNLDDTDAISHAVMNRLCSPSSYMFHIRRQVIVPVNASRTHGHPKEPHLMRLARGRRRLAQIPPTPPKGETSRSACVEPPSTWRGYGGGSKSRGVADLKGEGVRIAEENLQGGRAVAPIREGE